MKITAKTILHALHTKHSSDVFVSECKTGPSQLTSSGRLDAWAMKKSWSNPLVIGYEIKVNRADFLHDEKWRSYLDYCNEFYFVCPSGIIIKNEVPTEIGLIYISSTGTRLYTKKKATYRNIQIPEEIYRYILMARVVIREDWTCRTSREFWERWLEQKEKDIEFGHRVGERIRKEIKEKISKVESENRELKERIESYNKLVKFLESLGINFEETYFSYFVEQRIKNLFDAIPPELKSSLRNLKRNLLEFEEELAKLEGEKQCQKKTNQIQVR